MNFTDQEIETIKSLIRDHGCDYSLETDSAEYQSLGEKLGVLEPQRKFTDEELAERANRREKWENSDFGKLMKDMQRGLIESMSKQVLAKSFFDGQQGDAKIGSTLRIRLPNDYVVKSE